MKGFMLTAAGLFFAFVLAAFAGIILPYVSASPAFAGNRALVVYFSATGRTKAVAEQIANEYGAALFEIVPRERYGTKDLDYRAEDSRCVKEHNNRSLRPEIVSKPDLKNVDTVFLGYPVWWGEAPNILLTFLDTNDLAGKRVIPFFTSHSSPLGGSDAKLHRFAPKALWQPGICFNASARGADVSKWLKGLK